MRGLSGDNAVQDWAGLAGDAYREQFGDLPNELSKLEKSYRLAPGARRQTMDLTSTVSALPGATPIEGLPDAWHWSRAVSTTT
ncbi:hypothetical protein QMK19_20670 [Streptomyces sp. H10-C2]|uniref:hypothetical protein n=1 Tax=unclassified Streptomyces TaxID=2593676 RepID=UPI0024BB31B4|nr:MULTISPECIES: hypothetical protein [unclassified Streptomyces]MDJ0340701.1 hypothetical protein [Streptomyces sp. PH10-H1]MDJ0372027.1 hypothetical protein [Streptomyces sp. H10-C2]